MIAGYVSDEEFEMIQQLAEFEKRSVSNLVRVVMLKECKRQGIEPKEYLVEEE
jgi:hypothetical protein